MRHRIILTSLLSFSSLLFGGCTSMLLVKSAWDNHEIAVDGKDNDWGDTMFYISGAQMTAGVRNDSNYMYLILKTSDRRQAFQVMGLGLTVWFDPSGGSHERFGIHFPLGRREMADYRPQQGEESSNDQSSFMDRSPNELEILGVNENGPVRLSIADARGIELQINNDRQGLIYELRVPLHSSPAHPYAINAEGSRIGIGFEGGKFEGRPAGERRDRMGEGRGGDMGGEGMPGGMEGEGGEGMPRGDRYGSGQQRQERPKQIDFWLKVNLAAE